MHTNRYDTNGGGIAVSVKNIDTQIMIARTADFSRDTSALQKRPEMAQDYQAIREKINDAEDQSRVAKTLDTQKSEFHPDDGGGGSYAGGDGSAPDGDEENGSNVDFLVPPGNNVIDIKV